MKLMINPLYKFSQVGSIASFKQLPEEQELDETIADTIEKLTKRVEYEVPEYGRLFAPIHEEFTNPDAQAIAHDIRFTVKPSTNISKEKIRILKMEILSREGNSIAPIFEVGTKEEILNLLKDENLIERIKTEISNADASIHKKSRE